MNNIYPQVWINLPKDVRARLVEVFGIPRTGATEIRDQEVVSDGYNAEDLKSISLEKMTEYIGSEETFTRSWEITLAKVHAELNPPVAIVGNIDGEPVAVDIVEPMPEAVKEMAEVTSEVVEEPKSVINFTPEEVVPPFCNYCASKGVRHLKDCPNYVAIK